MFPVLAMNAWNDVVVVDSNFNLGTLTNNRRRNLLAPNNWRRCLTAAASSELL
jgi:hypothetical protein